MGAMPFVPRVAQSGGRARWWLSGLLSPFSTRSSGDPCLLARLCQPWLLGRNATDTFTGDGTARPSWGPRSHWGFTSTLTETPRRQARQEPVWRLLTPASQTCGKHRRVAFLSCEDTWPLSTATRPGQVGEGPSHLPLRSLDLSLFLPLQRPWGTGQGSASEHFISLHGKPCDTAGSVVSARPPAFPPQRIRALPAGGCRGPPGFRRATLSACFSFSFFLLKVCFQRKDRFVLFWHTAGLGWPHQPRKSAVFNFPSEHSFFPGHSHVLIPFFL